MNVEELKAEMAKLSPGELEELLEVIQANKRRPDFLPIPTAEKVAAAKKRLAKFREDMLKLGITYDSAKKSYNEGWS